jgi:hypothetical protein
MIPPVWPCLEPEWSNHAPINNVRKVQVMFIQNDRSNSHALEITDTELMVNAPSIFAEQAMPGVSPRYTFLPTSKIVEAMRQEGWKPYEARRPRTEARRGFQIHQVTFQRRDQVAVQDEYAPEVILINSHDRSSGYELRAGLYRFVCRNGLMVADSLIPAIHVRHTGQELNRIIEASFTILGQLPQIAERVSGFRSVGLSDDVACQFATKALALRYDHPEMAPIRAEQLLEARRQEDAGNDLWAVTNRVHENLLRGGMRDTSRVSRSGKPFRPMRAITGLSSNVAINLGIWDLAESFRRLN